MFAKLGEQLVVLREIKGEIQNSVSLARRKTDDHPIKFPTAGILERLRPETNNGGTPHFWRRFGGGLHELNDGMRICLLTFFGNGINKIIDACFGLCGFEFRFGHDFYISLGE